MATSLVIEEERGTCRGRVHPHNGYWSGNFTPRAAEPRPLSVVRAPTATADAVRATSWQPRLAA